MNRILFEKTGNAIYISHLDLMRLFQRAFKRAGLNLKHTQGFSPRALVSMALPLSLGASSRCEIMDFELVGQEVSFDLIREKLNAALPAGVRVLEVYDSDRKVRHLTHLDVRIGLEYDSGIPAGAVDAIQALFARDSVSVIKKGKNGPVEQDIIPMIQELTVMRENDQELTVCARICAQNPTLNPSQIVSAIEGCCPAYKPDFSTICRMEAIADDGTIFR